jgi:tryptophan-rich sensory protein
MNAWYAQLERPPLTPPNWIFGPVWSVLYLMIAAAFGGYLWRSVRNKSCSWRICALITLHLLSNFIWTPLFFGMRNPALALADIVVLDVTLLLLIAIFWKTGHKASSALLWPYLAWVSFATYLNAGFVILN